MYDLIVVGGGPAGSSAAITAARNGARVLLLERGRFPRQKVCGEFVSAESLGLLGDLLDAKQRGLLDDAIRIGGREYFWMVECCKHGSSLPLPASHVLTLMMRFGIPPRPRVRKPASRSRFREFKGQGRSW